MKSEMGFLKKSTKISISVILSALLTSARRPRQTDERWLQQPNGHIKIFQNENLILQYRYTQPPGSPNHGKLYFARHIPETRHENILIEGTIDPVTGNVTLVYEMLHGNVSVTSQRQQFWVRVANMTLDQGGRYLTDVNFDTDAALHDEVDVSIYKKPQLNRTQSPGKHSEHTLRNIGDTLSVSWHLNGDSSKYFPKVTAVTMSHTNTEGHRAEFIKHELNKVTYPDDSRQLRNRVSFAPGLKTERFQLTLWDMQIDDVGEFEIQIDFEDMILRLRDSFVLHVNPGFVWTTNPQPIYYAFETHDLRMNFGMNITKENFALKLKESDKSSNFTCALFVGQDVVRSFVPVRHQSFLRLEYVKESGVVRVYLKNVTAENRGDYSVTLMRGSNIILRHKFKVAVLTAADVKPELRFNLTDASNHRILEVIISDGVPKANISIFGFLNSSVRELIHQANDTRLVRVRIMTMKNQNTTVLVHMDYTLLSLAHEEIVIFDHQHQERHDMYTSTGLPIIANNYLSKKTLFVIVVVLILIMLLIALATIVICFVRKINRNVKNGITTTSANSY